MKKPTEDRLTQLDETEDSRGPMPNLQPNTSMRPKPSPVRVGKKLLDLIQSTDFNPKCGR